MNRRQCVSTRITAERRCDIELENYFCPVRYRQAGQGLC